MKKIIVLAIFCAACGGDDDPANNANNANNQNNTSDSSWTLSYSGDLTGEITGDRVVITGTAMSTSMALTGRGIDALVSGTLPIAEETTGEADFNVFSVTLEDGTECSAVAETPVLGVVLSAESNNYEIEFTGDLTCSTGDVISIDGTAKDT